MEPSLANENTRRNPSKSALMAVLGLGLGLAALGFFFSPDTTAPRAALVGTDTPDFEFELLSGERIRLASYRGKTVLIHFWAYWCEPCLDEMASLRELQAKLAGKDFVLLMGHVGDEREEVRRIPNLPSQGAIDVSSDALDFFGVSGLPHSVLIDPKGIVRAEFIGPQEWTSPQILSLLSGPFG